MTSVQQAELDVYKDIPGYRAILKAVLKNQIQLLVSCLCFFFCLAPGKRVSINGGPAEPRLCPVFANSADPDQLIIKYLNLHHVSAI